MISTYLNVALFGIAVLCGVALLAGVRFGRRSERGSKVDRYALIFSAAIIAIFAGGTAPLAAKNGSLITVVAVCFGLAISVGLLGGLMTGRRMKKERTTWEGVPTFLTLLLIALLLGYARHSVKIVGDALEAMGMDKPAEKVDPIADKDCPENLRSLYVAFEKYAEQNGSLPKANWLDDTDLTGRIVKDEWEHCPAVSNRHDAKFGYAYNLSIAGMSLGGKEKLKDLPKAADTPLLYDSTNLAKSAADNFSSLPKPGRHNGANNVLYLDGTIKAVK